MEKARYKFLIIIIVIIKIDEILAIRKKIGKVLKRGVALILHYLLTHLLLI